MARLSKRLARIASELSAELGHIGGPEERWLAQRFDAELLSLVEALRHRVAEGHSPGCRHSPPYAPCICGHHSLETHLKDLTSAD